MEQRLFTVTDDKGTKLQPIQATYSVEYKYEGEAEAVKVKEGDVKRGAVVGEKFPEVDSEKVLEYSEIVVTTKDNVGGWDAYSGKTQRFESKIPSEKENPNLKVELPFKGVRNPSKQEKLDAMESARQAIVARLSSK